MQDPIYSRIEFTPRPSPFAASALVLVAALGLWLSELILWLVNRAFPVGLLGESLLYYAPFMALPVLLYARRRGGLSDALRLNPLPPVAFLALPALAWNTMFVASLLSAPWEAALNALGLRGVGALSLPEGEGQLIAYILALAALPALGEELLFRGTVLSAWEGRGTRYAVGVSAALFALLHGNLYGLPAYLLVGTLSGFVTVALDSVYAGMAYHLLYNAACLLLPALAGADAASGEVVLTGELLPRLALEGALMACGIAAVCAVLARRARALGIEPIPRVRRPLEGRDKLMLLAALLAMLASTAVIQGLAQMGGAP